MTTIHVQVDEGVYERAKRLAEAQGRTVESVTAELLAQYTGMDRAGEARGEALIGLFADDPGFEDVLRAMSEMRDRDRRQSDRRAAELGGLFDDEPRDP